jgi:CheY-like chemotaxis protein
MPEMNGIELLEKLQQDGLSSGLEVFIVSTEGSEPRIAYLKSLGVRHFLRKPFSPEMFSELLGDYVGRKTA